MNVIIPYSLFCFSRADICSSFFSVSYCTPVFEIDFILFSFALRFIISNESRFCATDTKPTQKRAMTIVATRLVLCNRLRREFLRYLCFEVISIAFIFSALICCFSILLVIAKILIIRSPKKSLFGGITDVFQNIILQCKLKTVLT